MVFIKWKIYWTPYDNGWNDDDKEELSKYHDIQISNNLGSGNGSFSFKLVNFNGIYNSKFRINDRIEIYRAYNTTTIEDTDLLINGVLGSVVIKNSFNESTVTLKGENYGKTLLNAMTFIDASNLDIPTMLKDSLKFVGLLNPKFEVGWNEDNPILKKDGITSFPTVGLTFFYKPLKQILDDYSGADKTKDGQYYWYVDTSNKLIWRPRKLVATSTFDSETDFYTEISINPNNDGVKNFLLLQGGKDPANNQIQERKQDSNSIGKHGYRFRYVTEYNNLSETLIDQDRRNSGLPKDTVERYPDLTSDYTTAWKSIISGDYVNITGATETIRKQLYLDTIRAEIKARLQDIGDRILYFSAFGKQRVEIYFPAGTKNWKISDIIDCKISDIGSSILKLRVLNAVYKTDYDTFTLEEDEGSI